MDTQGDSIPVVLVAPALSMRLGLRAMLAELPGIRITLEAPSLDEIEGSIPSTGVFVLAGRAATQPGLERPLRRISPGMGVLFLLEEPLPPGSFARLAPRAWGVLSLDCTILELQAGIQAVSAGLWVGDPAFIANPLSPSPLPFPDEEEDPGEDLTPREVEVLQQLALGLANKQIATALGMSENTVKFHISSIYTKLGASNRAEAVRLGARRGFISL